MTSIRKVLFPIDPRFQMRMPLRYGVELAARTGAELGLVHVVRRTQPDTWQEIGAVDELVRTFSGDRARTWSILAPGDPSKVIAEYAAAIEADLIILSARDRYTLSKVLFGSTTRAVLSRAHCPVLVSSATHCDQDRGFECAHIACAVRFGPGAREVIDYTTSLAKMLHAGITFIHVMPDVNEDLLTAGLRKPGQIVLDAGTAQEKLREMTRGVDIPYTTLIASGALDSTLKKKIRSLGADLLVVGRKRGRSSGLLEALVGVAPCPVLTVPCGVAPLEPIVLPARQALRLTPAHRD